jgi:hypothetical protein
MAAGQQNPERLTERKAGQQDVEGLMNAYVISKLQESLDLSDGQFAEMVLLQKKKGEKRRNYRLERRRTLQQMRQVLQGSDSQEEQLTLLLKQLEELQSEFEASQRADYQAIDQVLDVRQRARYRLLELEIEMRFLQMVREVRGRRRPQERLNPQ